MSTPFDVRRWASQAGIKTTGGFAVVAECVTMDELERFAHIAISNAAKSWQQADRTASELQDTCHKQAQRIAALEQAARQALAAMEASGPQWHALERRAIAALREAIGAGGVEPLRKQAVPAAIAAQAKKGGM